MDISALMLSRIQFAFTVSFHIIFPAFTVGLAAWLAFLQARAMISGEPVYDRLFDFWLKIFAVAFGLGVVSGIVMAFQFGTNWSELARRTGPIQGPLLGYESFTAFALEASFFGVLMFGRSAGAALVLPVRLPDGLPRHQPVVVLDPREQLVDAASRPASPCGRTACSCRPTGGRSSSIPSRLGPLPPHGPGRLRHHQLLRGGDGRVVHAARSATAPRPAPWSGWGSASPRSWCRCSCSSATSPATTWSGTSPRRSPRSRATGRAGRRPARSCSRGPTRRRRRTTSSSPCRRRAGSLIDDGTLTGKVIGIKDIPKADRPPVLIPFFAFRIMVGCGLLMLALAWGGMRLLRHRAGWSGRAGCNGAIFLSFPLGFVATLTGWFTAEVGRQPWTVYGQLRTADAATPFLTSPQVATLARRVRRGLRADLRGRHRLHLPHAPGPASCRRRPMPAAPPTPSGRSPCRATVPAPPAAHPAE